MRNMNPRHLFGTDGIRGRAGEHPMTPSFAVALGEATAQLLRSQGRSRPKVVVGRDTRRSGAMLSGALSAGLAAMGAEVIDVGVMPTPGVSTLLLALGADAGAVISASHNPFDDNGIKLFGAHGGKLSDAEEAELEALLAAPSERLSGPELGAIRSEAGAGERYLEALLEHAPFLDGMRVGLDCAHGAASQLAPKLFTKIGARLDVIHADPNGVNINAGCGSTHPEALMKRVQKLGLDVGVTFDGDADRALLVDARGRLVSGDHILAICAIGQRLPKIVVTHMTNLGVERYLEGHGIELERVAVGDRYVLEALQRQGLTLGGEQSGHVLFLDRAPTGDGMLTALMALAALRTSGKRLEEWVDDIPIFPQALVNVRVQPGTQRELLESKALGAAIAEAEGALGAFGRVLVRASGTEPLIRVMVEAASQAAVDEWTQALERVVAKEAGSGLHAAV